MLDSRLLLRQKTAPRYVLEPVKGGYKIERLVWDEDFGWTHGRYLNLGRKFPTRQAATDYMISEVER